MIYCRCCIKNNVCSSLPYLYGGERIFVTDFNGELIGCHEGFEIAASYVVAVDDITLRSAS